MATLASHSVDGLTVIPAADRPTARLVHAPVVSHYPESPNHWALKLRAPDIAATARPGQFLMVTVAPGGELPQTLPRPMAISRTDGVDVEFVYGVVGEGTTRLTHTAVGDSVAVVGPLGQPFSLLPETRNMLVIGRGIGSCSLTLLVDRAVRSGIAVTAMDSARIPELLVGARYFEAFGADTIRVDDATGTSHTDNVEAVLRARCEAEAPHQIAVCGSARLTEIARRLGDEYGARVEVSIEAHMACGIGYCHGCSRGTRSATAEAPLVCKDGPVFLLDTAGEQEARR